MRPLVTRIFLILLVFAGSTANAQTVAPRRNVAPASANTSVTSSASPTMTLTLMAEAVVEPRTITIGDVAALQGADDRLRERILKLDLDEPSPGKPTVISKDWIRFRLQTAGISANTVHIVGESTRVIIGKSKVSSTPATSVRPIGFTRPDSETDPMSVPHEKIVAAAEEHILSRSPWPKESVTIRLGQTLKVAAQVPVPLDRVRLDARLRSAWPPVGRVQVAVAVLVDGQRHSEVPIFFEVSRTHQVVVAKRRIERGETITAEDVLVDRRESLDANDPLSSLDQVVGKKTKKTINALQAMMPADIVSTTEGTSGTNNSDIVIKRRDTVTATAKFGGIAVSTQVEAMQDGRVGEVIKLKNPESSSTIFGKVINKNNVEVQLTNGQ